MAPEGKPDGIEQRAKERVRTVVWRGVFVVVGLLALAVLLQTAWLLGRGQGHMDWFVECLDRSSRQTQELVRVWRIAMQDAGADAAPRRDR